MDLAQARSFARCLDCNTGRFQNVEIHRSERSRDEKFFITFQPVSASRLDALHSRQQEARQLRAEQQEFIFWQDPDCKHVYWCFSVASGETYQVTIGDCSCPDYKFRCQIAGIQCKHMLAWSRQRRENAIIGPQIERRPDIDFGPVAHVG
jgi:predicted nucleic acid-binding Zn finger protein